MKISEEKLKSLGFRSFVHLKKEKRDGLKRYVWVHLFENHNWVTVRIVQDDQFSWSLESSEFLGDFSKEVEKKFMKDYTIEEVFELVKSYS